jgi:hypothetical protein
MADIRWKGRDTNNVLNAASTQSLSRPAGNQSRTDGFRQVSGSLDSRQ